MFKQFTTFLLAFMLSFGPMPAFSAQAEVRGGSFPDGAEVLYLCEGKSSVKFMFTTPEKIVYQAELFCGDRA